VILRGERFLPAEITNRRNYCNFEKFLIGHRDMNRHPQYPAAIRELAEYITERHAIMRPISDKICKGCDTFSLPRAEDLGDWLRTISSVPFPGRKIQGLV